MADIYVSTTGNDSTGDGSSGNPYATITHADSVGASGDRILVKSGTYTLTATLLITNKYLVGYGTTVGDYGVATLDASGLGGSNDGLAFGFDHAFLSGIRVNGAPRDGITDAGANSNVTVVNCAAINSGRYGFSGHFRNTRCTSVSSGSHGFFGGGDFTDGCCALANGGDGFGVSSKHSGCIAAGNVALGFNGTGGERQLLANCVAYGNGSHGWAMNFSGTARNCVFFGNGGYGVAFIVGGGRVGLLNCAFGGNTSGSVFGDSSGLECGSVALTGDPFVDAANVTILLRNFGLNATAGAGAACRAAGIGSVPALTGTLGYPDLGAVQHADGGGSAGMLFTPGLEGM